VTENADVQVRDRRYSYPQLEPQLTMLYRAITRSINRLLFVETQVTDAGDALFMWLERHRRADKFYLAAAKELGQTHYIASKIRGIQFALQAERLRVGVPAERR
jgi:hypothetical protein